MLVAQLADARDLNPVVGNFYIEHLLTVSCEEKTKIKKKDLINAHLKRQNAGNDWRWEQVFNGLDLHVRLPLAAR